MSAGNYIFYENHITQQELYDFLYTNKDDGRVSLDPRVDIATFTAKIMQYGDFFEMRSHDEKIADLMVAYINNQENKEAFITYVRTAAFARKNGLASVLLMKYETRKKMKDIVSNFDALCSVEVQ